MFRPDSVNIRLTHQIVLEVVFILLQKWILFSMTA